MNILLVEDN